MPYIKPGPVRELLEKRQTEVGENLDNPGELNFCISILCRGYIKNHGLNYKNLNEVVGALECAKQEFIRRVVNPYEDEKIVENGDIYYGKDT